MLERPTWPQLNTKLPKCKSNMLNVVWSKIRLIHTLLFSKPIRLQAWSVLKTCNHSRLEFMRLIYVEENFFNEKIWRNLSMEIDEETMLIMNRSNETFTVVKLIYLQMLICGLESNQPEGDVTWIDFSRNLWCNMRTCCVKNRQKKNFMQTLRFHHPATVVCIC
jgi:hypothetical protein